MNDVKIPAEAAAVEDEHARVDVIATAVVVTVYMAFMLAVGLAPGYMNRPVTSGGALSIGMLCGIGITVFIVAAAKIYTARRNKQERSPS
jgi:uncharacterized membrane protein (DUF485 family)